jgi:hypothetical protein
VSADIFGVRLTKIEHDLEEKAGAGDLEKGLEGLRAGMASAEDLDRRAGELESARAGLEEKLSGLGEELEKLRTVTSEADEEAGQLAEKVSIEEEKSGALTVLLGAILKIHLRVTRLDMSLERLADAGSVQADIEEITRLVSETREKLSATTGTERIGDTAEEVLEDAMERVREIESELAEARGEVRLRALIREETGGMGKEDLLAQSEEQLRDIVAEMIRTGELHKQLKTIVRRGTERRTPAEGGGAMPRGRWLTVKDEGDALPGASDVGATPSASVDELLQKVVSSDDFKIALDERVRTMLEYLKTDAITRQFKKLFKEQQG